MRQDVIVERCSMCHSEINPNGCAGYEPVTVDENDKEIVLRHCPMCGTLFIHIETVPVHAR